jgi:hypothetical protein
MTFNVLYYSSSYIISQTYTIISLSVDMVNDISPPQQYKQLLIYTRPWLSNLEFYTFLNDFLDNESLVKYTFQSINKIGTLIGKKFENIN